jgi:flagellar FliJ protein
MRRFSFKLEKVLRLRKYREDEARIELGRAIGTLAEIEDKIKKTAAARSAAARQRFASVNEVQGNGQSAMLNWDNYINRLEQETEKLLQEAAKAELIVQEKRDIYIEASKEHKVMEKLKEKHKEEYRKECEYAQARELDDLPRRAMALS